MLKFPDVFKFSAPLDKYDFGKYYYTVVYLPEELILKLPLQQYPKLRVEAEIDRTFMEGAFMPDKGSWYLMVSKRIQKSIRKTLGDVVEITFAIADQDKINMHPDLRQVLIQNPRLQTTWDRLTPGKQRGWLHRLNQAKTQPTIDKRLAEIIEFLEG